MTSSASVQGTSGDALDGASRHLRALTAMLTQVFEALATVHADGTPSGVDSRRYDADFWSGLRDLMADLLRTAQEIQRLTEALRAPPDDSAIRTAETNGNSDHPSPAGLACDLARDALNVDLGTIIEDHEDDWTALVHAVRAEKFHGNNGARDEVEPLELYSKVITTLPVELRRDFRKLTEWRTADEIAERHAAFELGRQIERQARQQKR